MATIRILAWLNAVSAVVLGLYGLYDIYFFFNPPKHDTHGGLLSLFAGLILIALGLFFLLTSISFYKNWKVKWVLQALPLSVIAFFALT